MPLLRIAGMSLILLFSSSAAYGAGYPYDESIKKGIHYKVPPEFKNGTATMNDIKEWVSAFDGDNPAILSHINLDNDTDEEILAELVYARGGTANASYLAFDLGENGFYYLGELNFSTIRVITYPDSDTSYIITTWHMGADDNPVGLSLLKDRVITRTATSIHHFTLGPAGTVSEAALRNLFSLPH